jgi:hypothetical protein
MKFWTRLFSNKEKVQKHECEEFFKQNKFLPSNIPVTSHESTDTVEITGLPTVFFNLRGSSVHLPKSLDVHAFLSQNSLPVLSPEIPEHVQVLDSQVKRLIAWSTFLLYHPEKKIVLTTLREPIPVDKAEVAQRVCELLFHGDMEIRKAAAEALTALGDEKLSWFFDLYPSVAKQKRRDIANPVDIAISLTSLQEAWPRERLSALQDIIRQSRIPSEALPDDIATPINKPIIKKPSLDEYGYPMSPQVSDNGGGVSINAIEDTMSDRDALEAMVQIDAKDAIAGHPGQTREAMKLLYGDDSISSMKQAFREGGVYRASRNPHKK